MAHGVSEVLGEGSTVKMVHQKQQQQQSVHQHQQQQNAKKSVGVMGSRRIFAPAFKLKVLDSYRNDIDCRGNQRATARKYGIHRRQIQKWLQCEDNLRNSCAETGNGGGGGAVTTTVISPAGVSKPDGAVSESTGPAVTPAAPALNLSLARLHGDELATQQGPPPLLSRPPHGSSPSSPQYVSRSATASVLPGRQGYQEYSNQDQRRHRRETDDRIQVTDVHGYPEARANQEAGYYAQNADGQRELENATSFDARTEPKVYQTLTSYRYNENEIAARIHQRRSPTSSNHDHRSSQNYGDADSSVGGKSSYGLLVATSMIKTERASPDSAATPGPCESTSSPGLSRVPLSPLLHQASNGSSSSSSSATSVHFDSPRASASPCSLHVQEHARAHAYAYASPTPDSEKPIPSMHRQERESKGTTIVRIGEKGTQDVAGEAEIARAVVKEEIQLEEEENSEEGREAVPASEYVDYHRPPAGSSLVESRPVSPPEGYSLPSSPRGPTSSGRSSTSCSDSEMDPLDCSSGSHNSSNDLARRRSFSLRFKLDVLDAFHRDVGVAGNQRATARKFGINRRQVQKWLGQETELRGEIALRGNSRQRLGPIQDAASGDSPVDLRTSNYVSSLSQDRIEADYERSPPPLYCCDIGSSSSQHLPYYHHPATIDPSSETELTVSCNLSCCMDSHVATATSVNSCYQEVSLRGSCYAESQNGLYCYSPREYSSEITSIPEQSEESSSPLKRQRCTLSCCYEALSPPKRLCLEAEDSTSANSCQETPPQETPLCLVKPKRLVVASPLRTEPVTSTVPTPPASAAPHQPGPPSKKDAILFKPYLDNPVSKPAKEHAVHGELSAIAVQNVNNNNCQSVCNLNESNRGHDYALELSLRLPVSWRTHPSPYTEFPQVLQSGNVEEE
ncbi:uncharacterized protein LOC100881523 isoform X2 [Megachile rotundata]|uniref:uncharacterized protein LOC100881523 isoform X2 n=1 Tax=Megachile rotundata TaxID=143995 RepID=UPI003FD36F27